MKKFFILFLFLLSLMSVYADSYSVKVVNAEYLEKTEDIIELGGKVELDFTVVDENENSVKRVLSADKVIIDFPNKNLNALGSVVLKEGENSTFSGDAISLNWDELDVLVFIGKSSTDRKNADGKNIKFFSSGDSISYEGSKNIIFYTEGKIATQEDDPYWSVEADRLALVESDLFFENAVIKIGRVPLFYFPVFFYPSTKLSFNPAIGFDSSKGSFINTTTEIYGKYPNLGISGTPKTNSSTSSSSTSNSSSNSNGDSVSDLVPASLFSLLSSSDGQEQIRDGIIYRNIKEGEELSSLEKWARDSGSYLAAFLDIYSNVGVDFGFDTKNVLFNKAFTLSATGLVAYKHMSSFLASSSFRYYFRLNLGYSYKGLKLNLDIPILSDKTVASDFLNRNTVFGLDSVLGGTQYFPTKFNSNEKIKLLLSASWSKSVGAYNFNLKTAESYIELMVPQTSLKQREKISNRVSEALLPSISFTSNGTFVSKTLNSNKKTTKEEKNIYSSDLANSFVIEQDNINQISSSNSNSDTTEITSEASSTISNESNRPDFYSFSYNKPTENSTNGQITLKYDFKQTLDNIYKSKFTFSSLESKTSGLIDFNLTLPDNYFLLSEKITPDYTYKKDTVNSDQKLTIKSEFEMGSNFLGLTYKLKFNIYTFNQTRSLLSDYVNNQSHLVDWDKKDITIHSVDFKKKIWNFTLGLNAVLPPLDTIITPNLGFSMYGYSFYVSVPFYLTDNQIFKKGVASLNFSYKNDYMNFSFNNSYDFGSINSKYSSNERLELSFLESRFLKFTQEMKVKDKFELQSFLLEVSYSKNSSKDNSLSISFKDKNFTPDKLKLALKYTAPEFFFWRDRIGLTGSAGLQFIYDFQSKYNSSLKFSFSFEFAISELLDLKISLVSANNSFYRYYEDDKFNFGLMFNDFWKSFDIFKNGNKQSSFIMDSYSISLIHYMNDWTLTLTSTGKAVNTSGKIKWQPEFTALIRWNDIPELKSQIRRSENNDKIIWEKL